jgi:hypothetical protein
MPVDEALERAFLLRAAAPNILQRYMSRSPATRSKLIRA